MSESSSSLHRRRFLAHAAGGLVALPAAMVGRVLTQAIVLDPNRYARMRLHTSGRGVESSPSGLRFGVVATPDAQSDSGTQRSFLNGVELGLGEASRAATLLGTEMIVAARVQSVEDARALMERERPTALVCGATTEETAELGAVAAKVGVVLLNGRATGDALRGSDCARLVFHIAASDAMRAAARGLSSEQPGRGAEPTLWDARLERFGAAQLNARFESRFQQPMDGPAWAGWFSVKVAWEASQRAKSSDASLIAAQLERDTTQFDGHKGVPLSFRHWDHQLRQPLYLVPMVPHAASASGAQMPLLVPTPDATPTRTALDALGTSAEASACRWR